MRLYGKKFIGRSMQRSAEGRQETRDAVLWDVQPLNRICRCKIQGSNTFVIAHYPRNWDETPSWLRPGTAIRICHLGGVRGRVEVVGMGRAIPTPVSGNTFPDLETGPDGVLSDCYVIACATPRMAVLVRTGSYRISGTTYYLTPITLGTGTDYHLGDGGAFGEVAAAKEINAAPAAGLFRYDLISVGTDGVVDYTAGTAAATPSKPSIAGSHLALAYVLVKSGVTEILDTDINHDWTDPYPLYFTIAIADQNIYWADPVTTNVTVQVLDQYENPISGNYKFTLEFSHGNGTLYSAQSGNSRTSVIQYVWSGSSYIFTYTRDKLDPGDISPVLKASVTGAYSMQAYGFILLYDAAGNLMTEATES